MKALNQILQSFFLILLLSCNQQENPKSIKNIKQENSKPKEPNIFPDYTILDIEHSIDYNSFDYIIEHYKEIDSIYDINYYLKDSSFVRKFDNQTPQVQRIETVCGLIKSNYHLKSNPKIGITTNEFFKLYPSLKQFYKNNSITLYEDERGNFWTNYFFNSDTLKQIELSSNYDWVRCK